MQQTVKTPSEVKAMFRAKGETFAQWARENGMTQLTYLVYLMARLKRVMASPTRLP